MARSDDEDIASRLKALEDEVYPTQSWWTDSERDTLDVLCGICDFTIFDSSLSHSLAALDHLLKVVKLGVQGVPFFRMFSRPVFLVLIEKIVCLFSETCVALSQALNRVHICTS